MERESEGKELLYQELTVGDVNNQEAEQVLNQVGDVFRRGWAETFNRVMSEDELQIQVAQYLDYQYKDILWCHIANERKTNPARGAKLKKMGVRAGMPDIMIYDSKQEEVPNSPYPIIKYFGLAIELKIAPNKPTQAQQKRLLELSERGWAIAVCYDLESAKKIIDDYLK